MDGTITNTICIVVGSLAGAWLHSGIKEKYKRVLYDALGLASLAIGLNAAITHFPQSKYPVLFIVSLALGGVVGTWLDIDGRFQRLVNKHSKGGGEKHLAEGLSTAILLYCIGPLSMLGPVISALKDDNTFLRIPRWILFPPLSLVLPTASAWCWLPRYYSVGRGCSILLRVSAVRPSATL